MPYLHTLAKTETISMRTVFKSLIIAAAFVGAIATSVPAFAQTAEELRRDATACERPDGYMQALNPGVQAAVNTINQQRRSFYEMRAAEEGVDVAAVAAVFATQLTSQPDYRGC
jgi:uncharacterized protein YdbL (DUF1318 family)